MKDIKKNLVRIKNQDEENTFLLKHFNSIDYFFFGFTFNSQINFLLSERTRKFYSLKYFELSNSGFFCFPSGNLLAESESTEIFDINIFDGQGVEGFNDYQICRESLGICITIFCLQQYAEYFRLKSNYEMKDRMLSYIKTLEEYYEEKDDFELIEKVIKFLHVKIRTE